MTDADVDGSHIRTLLLTFFYRQMPSWSEARLRLHRPAAALPDRPQEAEEYVDDDAQLNRILIQLGTEEVRLRNLATEGAAAEAAGGDPRAARVPGQSCGASGAWRGFRRRSWKTRHPEHELPRHLVKVREGNDETVHYFHTNEIGGSSEANPDLRLLGSPEKTRANANRSWRRKERHPRAGAHVDLHESKAIRSCSEKLARKGLQLEHYSAQDKPLFELVEGEGEKRRCARCFRSRRSSRDQGGRAAGLQIKRFKGLGEMNPKELFETTMDPAAASCCAST
jgi:DNA gyrase subunit B